MASRFKAMNLKTFKTVVALFLQTTFVLGTVKAMGVFLSELHQSLGTTATDIGISIGLFNAFTFGPGPLVAWLYRRNSLRRPVLVSGALMASLGLILTSVVSSNVQLAACLSLAGIGANTMSQSLIITLNEQCPKKFNTLFGFGKSGYAFGMLFIPLASAYLMELYGWRGAVLILGGLFCNLVPLALVVDTRAKSTGHPSADVECTSDGAKHADYNDDTKQRGKRLPNPSTSKLYESDTKLLDDTKYVSHDAGCKWDGAIAEREYQKGRAIAVAQHRKWCGINELAPKAARPIAELEYALHGPNDQLEIAKTQKCKSDSKCECEFGSVCDLEKAVKGHDERFSFPRKQNLPSSSDIKQNLRTGDSSELKSFLGSSEDHPSVSNNEHLRIESEASAAHNTSLERLRHWFRQSSYNRDKCLLVIMLANVLVAMLHGGWHMFFIPRAISRGISLEDTLGLLYATAIACFIARFLSGVFLNPPLIGSYDLFLVVRVINVVSLLTDIFYTNYAVMVGTSFMTSFAINGENLFMVYITKERGQEEEFPLLFAVLQIAFGVGVFIGTYVTGKLVDSLGNYNTSFLLLVAIEAAIFLTMLPPRFIKSPFKVEDRREDKESQEER